MQPAARPPGLAWDWHEAARGAVCAVPGAAFVLAGQAGLGLFLTVGALPAAMLGIPRTRQAAARLLIIGVLFAAAYALGSIVGTVPVVAVASLTAAAYFAALAMSRSPIARLAAALIVPAFALGMNEPPSSGLALAAMFIAGSVWAVVVALAFTRFTPATPAATAPPVPPPASGFVVHLYAARFAAAAGIGLTLGFVLDVSHEGWIAAAAMFIMRPAPDVNRARAIERLVATFAGVLLAAVVVHGQPGDIMLAVIAVAALAAILATRNSRWYVSPFGTALIVLLISGINGTAEFEVSFRDRILETTIGAALAVILATAARIIADHHTAITDTSP